MLLSVCVAPNLTANLTAPREALAGAQRASGAACGCGAVQARQGGCAAPSGPVGGRRFDGRGPLTRRPHSGRLARRQSRGLRGDLEAEAARAGDICDPDGACRRTRLQSRPFRRGGVSAWRSAAGRSARGPYLRPGAFSGCGGRCARSGHVPRPAVALGWRSLGRQRPLRARQRCRACAEPSQAEWDMKKKVNERKTRSIKTPRPRRGCGTLGASQSCG